MKMDIEGSEFDGSSNELGWLERTRRLVMGVHTSFGTVGALLAPLEERRITVTLVDNRGFPTSSIAGPTEFLFATRREPRCGLCAG